MFIGLRSEGSKLFFREWWAAHHAMIKGNAQAKHAAKAAHISNDVAKNKEKEKATGYKPGE